MAEFLRLDAALVARGMIGGRDRAKELIAAGNVRVNGKIVKKPAFLCEETDSLSLVDAPEYVSRGGEKLEKALEVFPVSAEGLRVLDIGASTGGFTQCLLRHGAKKIYAVDVGHDQLAACLRSDPRVLNLEGMNIRDLQPTDLPGLPQLAVCDASFISIRLILPALHRLLEPGSNCIFLVKPQFEAGPQNVGKRGVIKDPNVHRQVLKTVLDSVKGNGFYPLGLTASPIRGGEGNIEFLLWFSDQGTPAVFDLSAIVREAQAQIETV